jgi:hypothetical protein
MALDINKMFSDMTGNPAEQDRLEGLARVSSMGTPGGMAAYLSPQRSRTLRQSMGGIFGIDTRNTQEKIPEILAGLDITDPASVMAAAQRLDEIGANKEAAQLRNVAIQNIEDNRVRSAQTEAQTVTAAASAANAAANKSQAEQTALRTPSVIMDAEAAKSRAATAKDAQETDEGALDLDVKKFNFDEQDSNRYRAIQEEQNRLEKLRIDSLNTNLTNQDKTLVNDAILASIDARGKGMAAIGLAAQFERLDPVGGFRGDAWEGFKNFLGTQEEVSMMKTEFTGFVTSLVVQGLPSGVASDKDIEMVQRGFPDASYNAEEIHRYMRGVAKVSFINAELELEKANWAATNGGNLAGFAAHWKQVSSDEDFIPRIEREQGVNFIQEGEEDDIDDSAQGRMRRELQRRKAEEEATSTSSQDAFRHRTSGRGPQRQRRGGF